MFHRPSALIAALNIRPPKRCRVETACVRARIMALMTAMYPVASPVLDSRVGCAAQPACSVIAESICRSSYESYRSGSSLSDHAGTPELAALVEDLRYVPCDCATSEDACPQGCRQSGSEPLACGRAHSSQSSSHAEQHRRQFHARALERPAPGGALAIATGPGCAISIGRR